MVGAAGFELATLCSQSSNAGYINQRLNTTLSNGGWLFVCRILKLQHNAVRQFLARSCPHFYQSDWSDHGS